MNEALGQLEQQYILLLTNFDDLIAACKTDAQRASVRSALVGARRNYWSAINEVFHTDDPAVEDAVRDLTKINDGLASAISSLNNIAKIVGLAESAVKIGAKLLVLAG